MSVVSSAFLHSGRRFPARPRWLALTLLPAAWRRRHRTCRELRALDDRALADVGIVSSMRRAELAKWFWQS